MLLSGKKIIITGGLTGIGRASAKRCVEYGANVITMSRKPADHPSAVSLIEELRAKGTGSIDHMQVDVEDRDCVFEVFDKAIAQLGGIDVLINSAGKPQRVNAMLEDCTTEDMDEMYRSHILGTLYTNQAVVKYMKKTGGSIVDFTSWAGVRGFLGDGVYGTCMEGVCGFVRNAAIEWGKYRIRVNALSPSSMTEMAEEYLAGLSKEEVDAWAKWMRDITPLPPRTGVVAPSEDVAGTVVFLASDLSINMTGQIVSCDNGQLMVR